MTFTVTDMTCNHCKMRIEKALKEAGFKKIKVDLDTKTVEVSAKKKSLEDAKLAVEAAGYHFQENA